MESPCRSHSGSLDEYPERFPGKTLQAIVDEWEPRPDDAMSEGALLAATRDLAENWSKTPAGELTKQIQNLLQKNRLGDYRKRIANVLYDMLDLLTNGEAPLSDESVEYIRWRINHLETDDGFFESPPSGTWDETPLQKETRDRQWGNERHQAVAEISVKAETSSPALRPHWLVQCGAMEFRYRRYQQAAGYFQRVCEAFPDHPRAEVAILMLARVRLDEWSQYRKSINPDAGKERQLVDEVRQAFDRYQSRYPEGRFAADVIGWKAGMDRSRGYPDMAFQGFLCQAKQTHHPEIRRRAFQQIEWLLRDLSERPDQLEALPWKDIAAEPLVALRMGYFMLDAESETDLGALMFRRSGEDHRVLESLAPTLAAVRAAAKPAWSRLEQALTREKQAYRGSTAIIRPVLQAWASIIRGEPSLALAMVDENTVGPGTDDALLVRALARVKAGQDAEALRAFDALDQQCPDSTLRRGSDLRRCDAWLHLDQSAAAIPLLWTLLEGKGSAHYKQDIEKSPALHLPGEIQQRLAAVLTFAPLPQLVAAARGNELSVTLKTMLHAALRTRYLAEENYAEAQRYAEDADFESWHASHDGWNTSKEEQAVSWRAGLELFQQLTANPEQAADHEAKAAAFMSLGKAWEKQLWRLLDGGVVYLQQGSASALLPTPSFQLRHHASILGLNDTTAAAMLDKRQEISHAIHCYDQALKLATKGSPQALEAMLALHAALRTRAEFSPYFRDRAVEKQDAAWSRALHDRIKADHADSDAAKSVVWWTFRPARTLGEWQPGKTALFDREIELASLLTTGAETKYREDDWNTAKSLKALTQRLKEVFATEQDPLKLRDELVAIRRATRREAPTAKAGPLLNHLDDLDLLLKVPHVSPETRTAYFQARMDGAPVPVDNPIFASIKDFATYWNAVITPSTTPLTEGEIRYATEQPERKARQRIAQAQVARMTSFLARFPESPKREAALARLAINTLRQSRSHCSMKRLNAVGTASTMYATFEIERGLPFDAKAVTHALDQYNREFPNGRYHRDLQVIRGIAARESQDWASAVKMFVAILNQPDQRDLHLDASNNLGEIFMQLLRPDHRAPLMQAIKSTPGAWDKLDRFIQSPTCGWQLHLLQGWFEESRK